ncbi:hypothetical protein Tco_1220671 [Tanacetum coccineum]
MMGRIEEEEGVSLSLETAQILDCLRGAYMDSRVSDVLGVGHRVEIGEMNISVICEVVVVGGGFGSFWYGVVIVGVSWFKLKMVLGGMVTGFSGVEEMVQTCALRNERITGVKRRSESSIHDCDSHGSFRYEIGNPSG